MPPPKAVGKSSRQPALQSKPAPRPVPVKRKRVVDTDDQLQDNHTTKKSKPASQPSMVVPVPPRSIGPLSKAKPKKKDIVVASDVPAHRTRSKVTDEQPKGMQTRRTGK